MIKHRIPIEERDFLYAKEAARALGISANSFYAHCRAGHIAHTHLGKSIRVTKGEVERIQREGTKPANSQTSPLD
jgi:excisionase family DNA binding protein